MDYKLEIKQIVDFPRCRIYRDFIQTLIIDKSIRTNGSSFLFFYLILCSYANYRTSYRRIEGITYTVGPGEWICPLKDLQSWFRVKFQHQIITILNVFEEQNYISYTVMGKEKIVKFKILDWPADNTVLEYNFPCKKDVGFFFFPIEKVHQLINLGKCSEMDILLDLWIHAIYNDPSVLGSDSGPVVYYRNTTGNPLTNYQTLSDRWGLSKASISRLLKKLSDKEMITLISFRGKYGSIIYLNSYLSVMFNISDVMIDKAEVAMKMQLPIHIPEAPLEETDSSCVSKLVTDEQIIVSQINACVSEPDIRFMVRKVVELLKTQGIPCCECQKTKYILSPLSACKDILNQYTLNIICPYGSASYRFELHVHPGEASAPPDPLTLTAPVLKGGE